MLVVVRTHVVKLFVFFGSRRRSREKDDASSNLDVTRKARNIETIGSAWMVELCTRGSAGSGRD